MTFSKFAIRPAKAFRWYKKGLKMQAPLITVAIPTFGNRGYLAAAVESVLSQWWPDMEIIVSQNPSGEPLELPEDSRIRINRNETNIGPIANWNRCIELATGKWIHILHDDDLAKPGLYQALREAEAVCDFGLFACRCENIDAQGIPMYSVNTPCLQGTPGILSYWKPTLLRTNPLLCPGVIVRRDVYDAVGKFNPDMPYVADWTMWVRAAAAHPIFYHPDCLAAYRRHTPEDNTDARNIVGLFQAIVFFWSLFKSPGDQEMIAQGLHNVAKMGTMQAYRFLEECDMQAAMNTLVATARGLITASKVCNDPSE